MTISRLDAVFDSSFKHDCFESFSDVLLCPLRTARGYHLIQNDNSDIAKIHPLALRIFAGFVAFTFLLPFTLLGLALHCLSSTQSASYSLYELSRKGSPPFPLPELSPGLGFRKGEGGGTPVSLTGLRHSDSPYVVVDLPQLLSACFAACFHTTESQEEIWGLIQRIRLSSDPSPFKKKYYAESYTRLQNNLVRLHNYLPGEHAAKSAKIYWSDRVENVLLPYLFETEKVNMRDLVFVYSSGEQQEASFQALNMDFTRQLQFTGIVPS